MSSPMVNSRILIVAAAVALAPAQTTEQRTRFHVRYVAQGAVYIDGGAADGLGEGMTVDLSRREPGAAVLSAKPVGRAVITAVATRSAVCELQSKAREPLEGDDARLSIQDETARLRAEAAKARRRYLQVVEFSTGDPLEEEVREYVPRPPLEEENRFRGRVAFERTSIIDHDSAAGSSSQNGAFVRVDWSRIGGSYWTLTGYWRGSMTSSQSGQPSSLLDLMNRTYLIGLFYANPKSPYHFGIGRLILPWATSLGTLDGGYAARRFGSVFTAGFFAGTSPDPTQWNYDPNRQTTGAFVNLEKGSYEGVHWSGTVGIAFTRVHWRPERQYLFVENIYSIGRMFSLFQNIEADYRNPKLMNGATGAQLSRSFATLRFQPKRRISFDLNHNYFRGVPTFDERLIGTGLLDQYLFTGLTAGVRVEPINNLMLTGTWGGSRRNGDSTHAINQFYGVTWKKLPWLDVRVDGRYGRFNSSFGSGSYESVSLSRVLVDGMRLEMQYGLQNTLSIFVPQTHAHFLNSIVDWQFMRHYFVNGGWLWYRGQAQNYDQIYSSLGYRF